MSSGATFDGLDHTPINTDAPVSTTQSNNAAYFVATDTTNQFRTGQTNMDFQITNTTATPTFTFKNNIGETNTTTIVAGNANLSKVNIDTLVGNSNILLDINGYSSSVNPLVRVNRNSSSNGTTALLANTSSNSETLAIINNSSTQAPVITCFAPNLTNNNINILMGKNNSSNSNAYYLKYIYDIVESSRRFSIQALGYDDSISVFQPNLTAGINVGTLVVNGGLFSEGIVSEGNITSTGLITAQSITTQSISGGVITGSSLNLSTGAIIAGTINGSTITGSALVGGTITGVSLDISSGTVTCGQVSSSGSITGTSLIGTSLNVSSGTIQCGAVIASAAITGTTQTLTKSTPGQILYLLSSESGATTNTTGLFLVRHNSSSITGDLYTLGEFFAPNMPSASSAEIRVGKNAATGASFNAFSAIFGYTYNTTASLRKGYIRLNNLGNTIEFFQPSVVGTTASTGSVVVTGDVAASGVRGTTLSLYETTSSANAVTLKPATATSAYNLIFPQTLGTTDDYLGLASSATGQLKWITPASATTQLPNGRWTMGGTNASQTANYATSIPTSVWANNNIANYFTSGKQSGLYSGVQNTSGTTLLVHVLYEHYIVPAAGATYRSRIALDAGGGWKAYTTSYGVQNTPASGLAVYTQCSQVFSIANSGWILPYYDNQSATSYSFTADLTVTVLLPAAPGGGGTGVQSITVSPTGNAVGILTGNGQQSGSNPVSTLQFTNTPTGSGSVVLATSPSLTTPTESNPTITGAARLTGSTSGLLTSLQAAASTTAYSFILPTAMGASGQYLQSQGSGNPLVWAAGTNGINSIEVSPTGNAVGILSGNGPQTTSTSTCTISFSTTPTGSGALVRDTSATLTTPTLNSATLTSATVSNSLSLIGGTSGLSVSLLAAPLTTNYSFILPPDLGVLGQMFISQGGGVAPAWSNTVNQLISTGSNNLMGSSTLVTTNDVLTVKCTNNTTANAVLIVSNTSSTNTDMLLAEFNSTTMNSGSSVQNRIGKNINEHGKIGYSYNGNGNTSNNLFLGLRTTGVSYLPTMKIFTQGTTSTNGSTGSVIVTGGLGANSLGCDALNIEGRTYLSGVLSQTDLTLWWAYNTTDATATVTYSGLLPPEISPTVNNRRYSYQQIGKQYSFAMNFCASISQVSKQLHVVFIRITNHTLPTPYTGYCEVSEKTTSPGYSMNLDTPFGCHIPAQ